MLCLCTLAIMLLLVKCNEIKKGFIITNKTGLQPVSRTQGKNSWDFFSRLKEGNKKASLLLKNSRKKFRTV